MGVLGPTTGEGCGLYNSSLWLILRSCLTVWLALGKSQEQPRSEVKGISEVQRREGTRICSYSEWWQSQAASQDKKLSLT